MNKVALITGGTSGLGLQIVKDLNDAGYKVISLSRTKEKIDVLHNEYPGIDFYCCNISNEQEIEETFEYISRKYGVVDVLINNAGIIHAGGVEVLSLTDWKDMIDVNLTSIFLLTKIILPLIKKSEMGNIINISSISSKMTGSSIAYSACKAALDMMTKSLAKELSTYNIRVNAVNPGIISTGFQIHNGLIAEEDYNGFLENISVGYPLGVGTAEDISNMVMYLISDKAKWITGSCYIIDGGKSINI